MTHVSLEEAQSRLRELVDAALRGDEVVIGGNGEPGVRLTRLEPASNTDGPQPGNRDLLKYAGCIDDLPANASAMLEEYLYGNGEL